MYQSPIILKTRSDYIRDCSLFMGRGARDFSRKDLPKISAPLREGSEFRNRGPRVEVGGRKKSTRFRGAEK